MRRETGAETHGRVGVLEMSPRLRRGAWPAATTAAVNTTTCPSCGITYGVGASPWCRDNHEGGVSGIEDVTWPGGITFENLGDQPVTLYSPSELKAELKARNLEPMIRHRDGDQHTRSWATMDPYTLENARILAERQATTRATNSEPGPDPATVALTKQVWEELAARS